MGERAKMAKRRFNFILRQKKIRNAEGDRGRKKKRRRISIINYNYTNGSRTLGTIRSGSESSTWKKVAASRRKGTLKSLRQTGIKLESMIPGFGRKMSWKESFASGGRGGWLHLATGNVVKGSDTLRRVTEEGKIREKTVWERRS